MFPGFGGQAFMADVLPKVRQVRNAVTERRLSIDIEVDGGVGPDTAPACLEAGATVLVAGTSVFKAPGGTRVGVRCLLELMGRGQLSGLAGA